MFGCIRVCVCACMYYVCMDVGIHVCISFLQERNISKQVASPANIINHNAVSLSLIRKRVCMLITDNAVLTRFTYRYCESGRHGDTLTNDVYQYVSK